MALIPCDYRGPKLPGAAGARRVICCQGKPKMLPVYECKLGNTGHADAAGVTWRDCRLYRARKNCTPETCLKAKRVKADG